tara:strand:- start:103 stop:207 length:105 start_codon:yes stop_codon:yes gene_type:complete
VDQDPQQQQIKVVVQVVVHQQDLIVVELEMVDQE